MLDVVAMHCLAAGMQLGAAARQSAGELSASCSNISTDQNPIACRCDCCGLFGLQYLASGCKRVDDEKLQRRLYVSRVRQTEVLLVLLHTLCSGAAFLLPCVVIHATQVRPAAAGTRLGLL